MDERETAESRNTIAALESQRKWEGVIDGTLSSAELEQRITMEKLKDVHLTPEGYREFVRSINTEYAGSFEEGGTLWLIDREGIPYLLVRNPKQAANHALPFNRVSTGVEIMTDGTRAQGSLTPKQLETALYLSYYAHTEVYGYPPSRLEEVVVGHRDINDRTGKGTAGKPDFFTDVIEEAVLPKLIDLAVQLR